MNVFRKLIPLGLTLALCLSLTAPAFATGDPPKRGELTYTQHIAPQYEDAKQFSNDGLAPVKQNGKWGFIDESGKVVINFQYDYAWYFNEGYAVVGTRLTAQETDTKIPVQLGFIDTNGKYTAFENPDGQDCTVYFTKNTNPSPWPDSSRDENSYVFQFHNGVAWIVSYAYKTDGKLIRPDTSNLMTRFKEEIDDYFSYWENITPEEIEEKVNSWEFSADGPMNEGLIPVYAWSGEVCGMMDMNGKIVHLRAINGNPEFPIALGYTSFNQGLSLISVGDNTYGFADRNYNWVIEPIYHDYWYQDPYGAQRFFGITGLASVSIAYDSKWGAIDKTGKTVIPFQYDHLGIVRSGLIDFATNEKYGYLDAETYQVAIPAQYEKASSFSDNLGLAAVYDGQNAFLIDTTGAKVPGSENLDPNTYFPKSGLVYAPDMYPIIQENGKYGYGKLEYLPPLPTESEMDSWAYTEVVAAIEEDLVPVYLQNLYRNNISREEFCDLVLQAITEMMDKDLETLVKENCNKTLSSLLHTYPFSDTSSRSIIAANALGIINGRGDRIFDPYTSITRQEAAVLLMRAAKVLGLDTSNIQDANFADSSSVGSVYLDGVNYVRQIGVMSGVGDNLFSPQGTYTRQQSYMTAYRLLQALLSEQGD